MNRLCQIKIVCCTTHTLRDKFALYMALKFIALCKLTCGERVAAMVVDRGVAHSFIRLAVKTDPSDPTVGNTVGT